MTISSEQLQLILPHRPPILMLDKVVEIVPSKSGKGIKHFLENDPCFAGHFPGMPILPGVLAIEALAQTAAAVMLAGNTVNGSGPALGLLGKVSEMSFYHRIVPGDIIEFSIEVERTVGPFSFVRGEATADGKKFMSGKLALKLEREQSTQN